MAPEAEQLRLLLVDDEPKLTEFLRMELEVEGYAVQIAHDGASGSIALRAEPAPDLCCSTGTYLTSRGLISAGEFGPRA